jgi:hypothetical protein
MSAQINRRGTNADDIRRLLPQLSDGERIRFLLMLIRGLTEGDAEQLAAANQRLLEASVDPNDRLAFDRLLGPFEETFGRGSRPLPRRSRSLPSSPLGCEAPAAERCSCLSWRATHAGSGRSLSVGTARSGSQICPGEPRRSERATNGNGPSAS